MHTGANFVLLGKEFGALERQYLAELPREGAAAHAVPMPPPSTDGREKLSSAHDAWSVCLRLAPTDARAMERLSLVEQELAPEASGVRIPVVVIRDIDGEAIPRRATRTAAPPVRLSTTRARLR